MDSLNIFNFLDLLSFLALNHLFTSLIIKRVLTRATWASCFLVLGGFILGFTNDSSRFALAASSFSGYLLRQSFSSSMYYFAHRFTALFSLKLKGWGSVALNDDFFYSSCYLNFLYFSLKSGTFLVLGGLNVKIVSSSLRSDSVDKAC